MRGLALHRPARQCTQQFSSWRHYESLCKSNAPRDSLDPRNASFAIGAENSGPYPREERAVGRFAMSFVPQSL
jgi:hypothetical protein